MGGGIDPSTSYSLFPSSFQDCKFQVLPRKIWDLIPDVEMC